MWWDCGRVGMDMAHDHESFCNLNSHEFSDKFKNHPLTTQNNFPTLKKMKNICILTYSRAVMHACVSGNIGGFDLKVNICVTEPKTVSDFAPNPHTAHSSRWRINIDSIRAIRLKV
jgi:hypothetical protein